MLPGLRALAVTLFLCAAGAAAAEDAMPAPRVSIVAGADAQRIVEIVRRSTGVELPAGPFMLISVPESAVVFYWHYVGGRVHSFGYLDRAVALPFLAEAA